MPAHWLFMLSQVQHSLRAHVRRELKAERLSLSVGQMGALMHV